MIDRRHSWRELLPCDAALNLAVFRVAIGFLLLSLREIHTAPSWAGLPEALATTPRGWGWALAIAPPSTTVAHVAHVVLLAGALFGAVGYHARIAFACVTIAALYLLALPLRSGLPYHYQHLVWFSALLAASPCTDALSVDAWRRRRKRMRARLDGDLAPARSPAYGVPIRIAWLLLGMVFFFPGLWKLRASGLGWITGDSLRNQMYWKWAVVPGLTPPFRIDRFPGLLHAGAAGVVLLELGFMFAVWQRWSRVVAVGAALVFHAFARVFMGIDFSGLWIAYVVFVDWEALVARITAARNPPGVPDMPVPLSRVSPALAVGFLLLVGAAEAGARGATTGWPFACYPTFAEPAGTDMPALAIALVEPGGAESLIQLDALADANDVPRERALGLRLLSGNVRTDRFAAYWARVATRPALRARLTNTQAVRFYAGWISTIPEQRDRPPVARRLVYELAVRPPESTSSTMIPRARSGATTLRASDEAANRK